MKWSEEVQCREGGKNETLWEKFIWVVKWWELRAGVKAWVQYVWEKLLETVYSAFLPWCCYLLYMLYFKKSCVYCC